jgi:phenylalanine-4-hydroxylase
MKAIGELQKVCLNVNILKPAEVPWFPTKLEDFDHIGKRILGAGDGIQDTDHPGFNDKAYRQRRAQIAHAALNYKVSYKSIPIIDYNDTERGVWEYCFTRLESLFKTNACEEFNWTIDQFKKHVGLRAN